MRKLILLLLFCVPTSLFCQQDKVKHFYAGVVTSAACGSLVYNVTKRPFLSCVAGWGAGCLAGLAKEYVYDCNTHGHVDKSDYMITGWGALTGALVLRIGIDIKSNNSKYRYL